MNITNVIQTKGWKRKSITQLCNQHLCFIQLDALSQLNVQFTFKSSNSKTVNTSFDFVDQLPFISFNNNIFTHKGILYNHKQILNTREERSVQTRTIKRT